MAKQIIVLEVSAPQGGQLGVNYLFWFPVTVGQESPRPAVSGWAGASTAENSDLQAGRVIEEFYSDNFPNTFTSAQIKAALVAQYNARKAYLLTLPARGAFYGLNFDGTVWSA
jgi:hypothetical protein